MRAAWAQVDLDAIAANVASIRTEIGPHVAYMAVVKADGYGHGDIPVARTALEGGAAWLGVALVEEGIRLREAGIEAPILVLSEPSLAAAAAVGRWSLTPVVYSTAFLEALGAAAPGTAVHVKVDTGMHRVGCRPDEACSLVTSAMQRGLRVEGVGTHFAAAEEDEAFTVLQLKRFAEVTAALADAGLPVGIRHVANSAGALAFPEARLDMVRVGLATYGLRPAPHIAPHVPLRPAMSIHAKVSHVQALDAGERLSYGRRYALPGKATIATVPVGYADGVPRALSGRAEVLVGGRRHPVAGTITMDQFLVDVGDAPVSRGTDVVILGRQGDAEVTADEWADALGTVSYEIVCSVGPRLPRRYVGRGA